MRTATIEAVLGPVAEAIGEFLIANEEAELHDIPLGDLTLVAEGVGQSVKGLLDVAHSLATSTNDEELKIEMPLACLDVENAVDGLKSSSHALKKDPLNTIERAKMIESAKGILNGTSRVLECFDDYEVRKIVRACQEARLQVGAMKKVESVNDLVAVIQPACQSLITLAQLADKRVAELLDPWTKVSLTQAREVIKGSSTLMVSSAKAYVTNIDKPSKDSAKDSRELCIQNLLKSIDEVEKVVQIKQAPPQEKTMQTSPIAKDRLLVREALVDIHNAVVAQSPEALQAAFKIFDPATNNVLANAKNVAANLQDAQKKAQILESIANIERLRKEVQAAAKYAIEHPDDPEAQRRLVDLLKQTDAEFERLDKLVSEALYDDINASLNAMGSATAPDATLAKLIAAAQAGDVQGLTVHARKLEAEAATLKNMAEQVAQRTTDPELARAIRDAQKFLDDLFPQVIAAAKTVALNPNDPAAREHLTAVVAEWESGVSRLKTAIHNAQSNEDVVSASAQGIRLDLNKFQEACKKQDANLLKESSVAITQKIQAVSAAAQREIDNSSDPEYQQTLRTQVNDLQKLLPELQMGAKAAFSNPNDLAAQQALKQTSDKLVAKMNDIKDTMHQHHNPSDQEKWMEMERHVQEAQRREEEKKAREEERKRVEAEILKKSQAEQAAIRKAEEERRKAEELAAQEEARKAAEEEQAFLREQEALRLSAEALQKTNPIKAAALDLKMEANKWESEGNQMIKMSQSLANNMALLSELAQLNTPDAKKRLIETARKIAEDSKIIEKEAKRVAENCTDKRLKQDLQIVADRVGTIANQIKILSTVKAANPNDHDNDLMLITAATNLMSSVKTTIDASQSAQIRSLKTTATVVTAALKWKRKAAAGRPANAEPQSLASLMKATKIK